MTESEALVIRNMLNGVEPAAAARAAGLAEGRGLEIFGEAMKRVAEYQLVMCVPYFPVSSLSEARKCRLGVLEILAAIERWDVSERDITVAILKGGKVLDQADRAEAVRIFKMVLDALPHYLTLEEGKAYAKDRNKFVRDNRKRVLELVERFPSLEEPLQYKNIIHYTGGLDGLAANLRNL